MDRVDLADTRVDLVHRQPQDQSPAGPDRKKPVRRPVRGQQYLLALIVTVLAAGIAAGLLFAGEAIGHRYTTVHSKFVATTATATVTHTRTVTHTAHPRPKVITVPGPVQVITHTAQAAPGPAVTVTQAVPAVTVTQTVTAPAGFGATSP